MRVGVDHPIFAMAYIKKRRYKHCLKYFPFQNLNILQCLHRHSVLSFEVQRLKYSQKVEWLCFVLRIFYRDSHSLLFTHQIGIPITCQCNVKWYYRKISVSCNHFWTIFFLTKSKEVSPFNLPPPWFDLTLDWVYYGY